MTQYVQINTLAKSQGRSYKEFIALAPQNDPFYAGSKGNRLKAEWFSSFWQRFGYTQGAHLRRIHYRLVSGQGIDISGLQAWIKTAFPQE